MCLYPKLIKNPKYKENKKNGGNIPAISDMRVLAVPIGCGRCKECLKKKSNDWKVRLFEEVKTSKNGQFVTLTFSNDSYKELCKETSLTGYELDNFVATLAVRRFLERWRKQYKKSVKHWLVTELGHKGTENIHIHGILWTDEKPSAITKHWQYGYVWNGYDSKRTYVNEKTVNYITKYITKTDQQHKYYTPKVLTSKGIGAGYIKTLNAKANRYNKKETKEYYITKTGHKMSLPVYYRNKIYSEKEKEELWINKLDEQTRYVDGIKIDISENQESYINIRNATRAKYLQMGYNGEFNWKEEKYENEQRELLQIQRGAFGDPSPGGQVKVDTKKEDDSLSQYTDWNKWI